MNSNKKSINKKSIKIDLVKDEPIKPIIKINLVEDDKKYYRPIRNKTPSNKYNPYGATQKIRGSGKKGEINQVHFDQYDREYDGDDDDDESDSRDYSEHDSSIDEWIDHDDN